MSDDRGIFIKFQMDKNLLGTPSSFTFSLDKADITTWDGSETKTENKPIDPREEANPESSFLSFKTLNADFLFQNSMFYISIPSMLSVVPYVNQVKINRELRNFAKTMLVSQDIDENFELYELPHHALPELLRRIESIAAFGKGISILPNIFLMGLVSSYDAYLSDLIRTVLNVRLEIISSSEKSITLKELVEIGSVHDARQRIIDKEIDALMRESHAAQVEWIENKLGTKIKHNNKIWPQYIELFERRNLLSHTAGIISPQYMKVCAEHGVDVSTLREGSAQNVTPKYLVASVDLLAEFGVKLCSRCVWVSSDGGNQAVFWRDVNAWFFQH